ncbi:MAG: aspAT 2 [Candidatus Brocadiaceae bacterium]|nr:aspAT 2 [Candidatus Brocadiaceae bacterium]
MLISNKVKAGLEASAWAIRMFDDLSRDDAKETFDFRLGNPEIPPPALFFEELKKAVNNSPEGLHQYSPLGGHTRARDAVANTLTKKKGLPFTARHVVMTSGGAGALNIILKAILNPGDEVLVLAPLYLEYPYYIENHGGVCLTVETNEDFTLNVDAIAARLSPRTKAIIVNSPNNPTGAIYSEASLKSLAKRLEERGRKFGSTIFLIYDAAYEDIVYDGVQLPEIFKIYKNTILAASFSKPLSIPGERIGYAAVHPEMDNAEELADALTFTNRVLGYLSAPVLMQHVITHLQGVRVNLAEYQERRDMFYDALKSFGYSLLRPQGAYYLFPKTPVNDVTFMQELAKEGVLVNPGSSLGRSGYLRIAFCKKKETIQKSLPGFKKVMDLFR